MALYQTNAGDRILAADINQYYQILKGVAASGEAVTLIYNAAGVIALIPSSDPAAGTELIQIKNAASTVQSALSSDGRFYPADGLVGTPGVAFELDKDTGLWRVTTNTAALVAGGVEKLRADATGVSFDGGTTYIPTVPFNVDSVSLYDWYWRPSNTIGTTLTGTGTYTVQANGGLSTLSTGATSGSNVGLLQGTGIFNAGNNGAFEVRWWSFIIATDKAASQAWRIFITDEVVTGQPSLTAKHLGMKFDGTSAFFSTADGTTEQTTDVTAQVTANTDLHCVISFDGTTARLYMDGSLRATHATNVPTTTAATAPVFRAHITNSAAADKLFYIAGMNIRAIA